MDWLVLHAGALGDLVLTLQLARRLPRVAQGAGVTLISRTDPGDLRASGLRVQRLASEGLGLQWLHAAGDGPPERLRELVAGRHVLSALGGVDSTPHERLRRLGARCVYSFDPRPAPDCVSHITVQWQRRLEEQGMLLARCVYEQRPHGAGSARSGAGLARNGATRRDDTEPVGDVLIHPGSGGRGKCWALAAFLDVARRLQEAGRSVRFVLGPAELERWPRESLAAVQGGFAVACPDSIRAMTDELRRAAVYVGNDAGPSHLAALLGVATVTIFGPTDARVWRPLGPRAVAIQGDPRRDAQRWGVEVGRVVAAASEWLDANTELKMTNK
jgi:hypothetical protein